MSGAPHAMTKGVIQHILETATKFEWTLQGFGMLRTYLPGDLRLAVWDSRYAVPNVSVIHDHPWSFESLVVAGRLHNTRFVISEKQLLPTSVRLFCKTIRPGIGFIDLSETTEVWGDLCFRERYEEGQTYKQRADEVHWSQPDDGTVTLVARVRGDAPDAARTLWESGDWVSAEPRRACDDEVLDITQRALERWFAAEVAA